MSKRTKLRFTLDRERPHYGERKLRLGRAQYPGAEVGEPWITEGRYCTYNKLTGQLVHHPDGTLKSARAALEADIVRTLREGLE